MEIKVSVLITTYNLEQYVDETLKSVMDQQTEFAYEVLVGDDGSGDGTVSVIRRWQKKYPDQIRYFVMDRDPSLYYSRIERASKNRLHLLNQARGEYVIFLDGDDVYTDMKKLQKQVEMLDKPENRGCVACAHNIYVYWSEERKELLNQARRPFRVDGRKYWKNGMYFHSDTVLFRNICRTKGLAWIPDAYFDDNIIVFSLLTEGDLLYIPDVMGNYRQIENSSWNSVDDMEKHMINLMDVDIEKRMNPGMYRASVMRHMGDFYYIWRNRLKLKPGLVDKYLPQLDKDELVIAKEWLTYENQTLGKRTRMTCWFFASLVRFLFVKAGKIMSPNKVN